MSKIDMIEQRLSLGIINWYPFKENGSIYFTDGCCEELKKDLLDRGLHQECGLDGKYDYVLAYLYIEKQTNPAESVANLRKMIKEDGHLFLVCENRFALKHFIGDYDRFTEKVFDGIEGYRQLSDFDLKCFGGRCYSRKEILSFLDQAGFSTYRGFSVLSGLLMPQQIFSWSCLPKEKLDIRFTPLYNHPGSIFANEAALYDGIIDNDMFHQMANAYLIDCSLAGSFYPAESITVSMDRGEERAMATIIEKGKRVIKKALYPQGNSCINSLIENSLKLKAHGVDVVEQKPLTCGTCRGEKLSGIEMKYIDAPTALEYFERLIFEDKEQFKNKLDEFISIIYKSSEISDGPLKELGPCYKDSYIDMVPLNCFYKDNHFLFFDQEFSVKKYPVSIPVVRAIDIIYRGNKRMNDIIPDMYFFDKYGLTKKLTAIRNEGNAFIDRLRKRSELSEFNGKHRLYSQVVSENRERMNFSAEEYTRLYLSPLDNTKGKRIYVFGSGSWGTQFQKAFSDQIEIEAFIDNNSDKWGKQINGIRVTDPGELTEVGVDNVKVIVCVKYYGPIVRRLKEMGVTNYCLYCPSVVIPNEGMGYKKIDISQGIREDIENPIENPKIGYVAGVFDLFHLGHLNILKRAKEHCDYLLVGVVSDEQAARNKLRSPYINENERLEIVRACKYVDEAFVLPPDASGTRDVFRKYRFDIQFSGSDYAKDESWLAEQKWLRARGADLMFFPYTESTSSSHIKDIIEASKP